MRRVHEHKGSSFILHPSAFSLQPKPKPLSYGYLAKRDGHQKAKALPESSVTWTSIFSI
jgi:hypothetical protein